jgi:hypothetical protein
VLNLDGFSRLGSQTQDIKGSSVEYHRSCSNRVSMLIVRTINRRNFGLKNQIETIAEGKIGSSPSVLPAHTKISSLREQYQYVA